MINWVRIEGSHNPLPGSRILVFTPTETGMRYRVMDSDLLRTASEATHWANLQPPDEYWDLTG